MKKRLTLALAAGALVVATVPGMASADGPVDRASGSMKADTDVYASLRAVSFTAQATGEPAQPDGSLAKGQIDWRDFNVEGEAAEGADAKTTVERICVSGPEAVLVSADPFGQSANRYGMVYIKDNGVPGDGVPDFVAAIRFGGTASQFTCSQLIADGRSFDRAAFHGQGVVHDAD